MKKPLFKKGDAVVWSGSDWNSAEDAPHGLSRTQVYTVAGYYFKTPKSTRYLYLAEVGQYKGYAETGFDPAGILSREELAAMLSGVIAFTTPSPK